VQTTWASEAHWAQIGQISRRGDLRRLYFSEYIGELAKARRSVCGPIRRRYGAKGQVRAKNGEI